MVVVDASVWVSWLRPQDANHPASFTWIQYYRNTESLIVAPLLLLVEVTSAIARQTKDPVLTKEIISNLVEVSVMRLVPMDFALIRTAVNIANELQLRAGDATYVEVAHQLGIPLISWDKEQLQKASQLIQTYTPDMYPFAS